MPSAALGFWLRKRLLGEIRLPGEALSWPELNALLAGQSVALVGNARSLAGERAGPEIDGHDLVVRLNDGPIPSPASHGARTDLLAVAKSVAPQTLAARRPRVLLWMPTSRKRLTFAMAGAARLYLNPPESNAVLRSELGAPPSVGFMVIDLLRRSDARAVRLFGFDFFASRSLTGSRTIEQVPHDFEAEGRAVARLVEEDGRFSRRIAEGPAHPSA